MPEHMSVPPVRVGDRVRVTGPMAGRSSWQKR
jgi:hypothetical protein